MLWIWHRLKLANNATSPFEISVNLGATKSLSCWFQWINKAAPKNKLKQRGDCVYLSYEYSQIFTNVRKCVWIKIKPGDSIQAPDM